MLNIKIEDSEIKVKSDYNSDFVKKAKMLQGKWKNSCWVFPAENEKEVRELCLDIFGNNGLEQDTVVTIDVHLDDYDRPSGSCIKIGNMKIVERVRRDRDVVLADNVMLVAGDFPSWGGSVTNPKTCEEIGTILRVKNFPEVNYKKVKDLKGIVLVSETVNKEVLIAERETLLERLGKIEKILGGHDD